MRDSRKPAPTVAEWGKDWSAYYLAVITLSPSTVVSYKAAIRIHINPAIGRRRLDQLTRADIVAFTGQLNERLAPSSVHNVISVLRRMLADAVRQGLIELSPCNTIDLPAKPARSQG